MSRQKKSKDTLQEHTRHRPDMARHLRKSVSTILPIFAIRMPRNCYARLRERHGGRMDRCVLYAFRCAVYYASNEKHDPELLKWWNWKDGVR